LKKKKMKKEKHKSRTPHTTKLKVVLVIVKRMMKQKK